MARAKRHFIPNLVWHITHRCHKRAFLLKFSRDKRRWLYWLFQAKKKYGLSILNFSLTSNHIHLLVYDRGKRNVIPDSLLLVASRTAQEYNQRKIRSGAFWEDRYHATAVETGRHLMKCMVYIDLNMVRTGKVKHPEEWPYCGYNEIMSYRQRYKLLDYKSLIRLLGIKTTEDLQVLYKKWIEEAIDMKKLKRESRWTESIAVGSKSFLENIHKQLGFRSRGRRILEDEGVLELREMRHPYSYDFISKKCILSGNKQPDF